MALCVADAPCWVRRGNGELAFEGRVEQEAACPNHQIATVGHQEDLVMLMTKTAADSLDAQPHKQKVGHGVDNFRRVDSGIVVLRGRSGLIL